MLEPINQPVSVISRYDHNSGKTMPVKFKWRNGVYLIKQLGFHHTYRDGRQLIHVFEGVTASFFFRLVLDSETLKWTLEKISDGEVN